MDVAKLKLILEALQQSEPKAKHYPEPVERHARAIQAVTELLEADAYFTE
jgi:hypothetical protein